MPLYRVLNKGLSAPPTVEPTRRVARPEPGAKSRSKASQAASQVKPAPVGTFVPDTQLSPVVGWLAVIAGPGRGQVLPLNYGVNDIGRGPEARVRLDFGDTTIMLENQAAIIYTARSRRFYLQVIAADAWLNGRPARGSVELSGGEILRLGQSRLRFVPLCGPDFDWHDDNQ